MWETYKWLISDIQVDVCERLTDVYGSLTSDIPSRCMWETYKWLISDIQVRCMWLICHL